MKQGRVKPRLPREAWLKLRAGGVQTTKRGKKGYNRKEFKQSTKKEVKE